MVKNILLDIQDLSVRFRTKAGEIDAVNKANIKLYAGDCLGVAGESGSGKSVTSLSILNLIFPNPNALITGKVLRYHDGHPVDLLQLDEKALSKIRGNDISMVFQEPMSSLNPVKRCGSQIEEVLEIHNIVPKAKRKDRVLELIQSVELPDVERIYRSYPHELSGGQLQRVNIAMALAGDPKILICDEPTTALDVTVQKKIIELLQRIVTDRDIALIFVCHDLDLVAELCNRVVVMYNGDVVEQGQLPEAFHKPQSAYTQALLACRPKPSYNDIQLPTVDKIMSGQYEEVQRPKADIDTDNIVLSVEHLTVKYRTNPLAIFQPKKYLTAVDDISFNLPKGAVLGIVGESGSGKSTVAKCICGVIPADEGVITYEGKAINNQVLSSDKSLRRKIQIIFQDPHGSLNPRMSIGQAILEPIKYHKLHPGQSIERVIQLLNDVGLDESYFDRYPHQLSGGQRQRICIARALSVEPEVLLCDESVSALDVSVQSQILNLLDVLKSKYQLSIIFISHDLSVIHYISDEVIVMKDGRIVERGSADQIINSPKELYTQQLVSSIPQEV
jgi:peptide/nickel transport system ATP-binding protein